MKDAYFLLALYGVSRCHPAPPHALAQQPAAQLQQLHTVQYSGRTVVAARVLFKPKAPLSSHSSYQDTDSVGEGLAELISGFGYVQATYEGSGVISLSTYALGPYTGYSLSTSVANDCDPASECGRAPTLNYTPFTAGH